MNKRKLLALKLMLCIITENLRGEQNNGIHKDQDGQRHKDGSIAEQQVRLREDHQVLL